LILLAGFWVYAPCLRGEWLWDDNLLVTANPLMNDPAGWWKIWFQPGVLVDYYPATFTVLRLAWNLWGMDTSGYHFLTLALHLASAFLVWRILGQLGLKLAFWGGLLFAVHPGTVESVAWIAELKNTLSLPPLLLAMSFWIDYDARHRPRDYVWALVFFILSLLCKSAGAMLPAVLLLYAWWKNGRLDARDARTSIPFFLVALALGSLGLWLAQHHPEPPGASVGWLARIDTAGHAFLLLLLLAIFPFRLLPIYPSGLIMSPAPADVFPWLALGAAIYVAWRNRRGRGRHVLLGFGFFALNTVPSLVYVLMKAPTMVWSLDHLIYISMIGPIGLAIAGLEAVRDRGNAATRRVVAGFAIVLTVSLAWGARTYAEIYGDGETLWTYAVQGNPGSWLARANLAEALGQRGRIGETLAQLKIAESINPRSGLLHADLAKAFVQTGQIPDAIAQYQAALQANPDDDGAAYALGNIYIRRGQFPEAQVQFAKALQINPRNFAAHYAMGGLLLGAGHLPEAIDQFQQSLALAPAHAEVHVGLATAYMKSGQWAPAADQYQQALALNPGDAGSHANLGVCLARTGRMPEAATEFRAALQIDPNSSQAHYNLGSIFYLAGDLAGAIAEYQAAVRLDPTFTDARTRLAQALALQKARGNPPPSP
jgi:tetratricopeptide (TPR) repeat protein